MTQPLPMAPAASLIRPAHRNDVASLASLLVQLYQAELPGALVGRTEDQQELLRFTLEADPQASLRHRYVACLDDKVVATGMLQQPADPDFERAPKGTLGQARALLGSRGAAHLVVTVARSTLGVYRQTDPDAVLFHSVVVDTHHRGQGVGRSVMRQLESQASRHGFSQAYVQVLSANEAAYKLYASLGYQQVWRTPPWKSALSWPSRVMKKTWGPDSQDR